MTIYRPVVEESSEMYAYEADPLVSEELYQDEASTDALAMELLAISDEQELDQFLGKLVRSVGRAIRSPVGQALVSAVRPVARTFVRAVIPKAATFVGTALGGPVGGVAGAATGAALSSLAGRLGLELEGMSAEDQTFEIAKGIVGFVKKSASNLAAVANQAGVDPARFARNAAILAARQVAPGLVPLVSAGARLAANGSPGQLVPRLVKVGANRWMLEIE
jgi:hypothetical protein